MKHYLSIYAFHGSRRGVALSAERHRIVSRYDDSNRLVGSFSSRNIDTQDLSSGILDNDSRPVCFCSDHGHSFNLDASTKIIIMNNNKQDDESFVYTQLDNEAKDLDSFRAIIVGGGPAGLATAHALTVAGIDWVLLERQPNITTEVGASVVLLPHSLRFLDQLGLLGEMEKASIEMRTKYNITPDGSERGTPLDAMELMKTNHGRAWMLMARANLIEVMYETLRNKDQVLVDKAVTDIKILDSGVSVICADGTAVRGSLVIGCDGAHSAVRDIMDDLRPQTQESPGWFPSFGRASPSPRKRPPMETSFHGLVGWGPRPDGVRPNATGEARAGGGRSYHLLAGADVVYFLAYVQLDEPRCARARHSGADADALAAEVAGGFVGPGVTFGDLWRARRSGAMVDFEEGVADAWHHGGRVVLLGDAAHKFTPNSGLGLNAAWQDAVELTNGLRAALLLRGPGARPDAAGLERVFAAYQGRREGYARDALRASAMHTRVSAHAGLLYSSVDWLVSVFGADAWALGTVFGPFISKGVVLDFAPEKHFSQGKLPWLHGRVT